MLPTYEIQCAWCKRVTGYTTVEHSHTICERCSATLYPEDQMSVMRGLVFALRIEVAFVLFALGCYYAIRVLS